MSSGVENGQKISLLADANVWGKIPDGLGVSGTVRYCPVALKAPWLLALGGKGGVVRHCPTTLDERTGRQDSVL